MNQTEMVKTMIEQVDFLQKHRLVAVIPSGSRLYNLETESSDYDYKFIYVPTSEEVYYAKQEQSKNFRCKKGDYHFEINAQDIRFFINQLRKSPITALELLFYKGEYVPNGLEHLFDMEVYHSIFKPLVENKELVEQNNVMGIYDSLTGQMFQRKKKLEKNGSFKKDYTHFLRYSSLLTTWDGHLKPERIILTEEDDLHLKEIRTGELTFYTPVALQTVDEHIAFVQSKPFKERFRVKNEDAVKFLDSIDKSLMHLLVRERGF